MDKKLRIEYDKQSDTLHIDKCPPYVGQELDDIGDDILGRFNPKTHDLENIQVLSFMSRLQDDGGVDLPLTADFQFAVKADV